MGFKPVAGANQTTEPPLRREGGTAANIATGALILGVAFSQRIALANILLGVAFLVWLHALARGEAAIRRSPMDWALLGYLGASLISVVFSLDRAISATAVWDLPTVLLVPMAVSLLDTRRWDLMLKLLAAVAVASSLFGLWQYLQGASTLGNRVHGIVSHYMTFSGWTLIVALLLAGDMLFNHRRRRIWTVPAFALCVTVLGLTFTRGACIGLVAGLLVAVLLWRPKALVFAPLVLIVVWAIAPRLVTDRAVSILDPTLPSNYDRLCMASAGLKMTADHPLTGVGLDMVGPTYEEYRVADAVTLWPGHLHNNGIQLSAERGLLGLAAYLAILAVFGVGVWRSLGWPAGPVSPAVAGSLAAVVGITVFGFFEYTWGDAEVWIPTLACIATPFALGGDR